MHLSFLFLRIRASNVAHYFHTKKIIRFFLQTQHPVQTGLTAYPVTRYKI